MLLGILCSIIMWMFSRSLLALLGAPALEEATTYLKISSVGFVFIWGYNGLSAILRAMGDSNSPFRIIMISSITNIILDFLMMGIWQMGVAGAALATMLSQALSFFLSLALVLKNPQLYGLKLSNLSIVSEKCINILHLGVPCALQMTIAAISWLVTSTMVAQSRTKINSIYYIICIPQCNATICSPIISFMRENANSPVQCPV